MEGIDGYRHKKGHLAHTRVTDLLAEVFADAGVWERATRSQVKGLLSLDRRAVGAAILAAPDAEQRALALALCERLDAIAAKPGGSSTLCFAAYSAEPDFHHKLVLEAVLGRLLRRRLDYSWDELALLLDAAERHHEVSTAAVLSHVERHVEARGLAEEARVAVGALRRRLRGRRKAEKIVERCNTLLGAAPRAAPAAAIPDIDAPWVRVLREGAESAESDRASWRALLTHAREAAGRSRPTMAWNHRAAELIERIGRERFVSTIEAMFSTFEQQEHGSAPDHAGEGGELLKALAWCCAAAEERALVRPLAGAARTFYSRVEGFGPFCPLAGGGCVHALGELGGGEAVAALLELAPRLEYQAAQRAIQRALDRIAVVRGVEVEALGRAAERVEALDPEPLHDALRALRSGAKTECLEQLLDAWRLARSTEFAEAVERLSAVVAADLPAVPGETKSERLDAWLEIAARKDPADLPRLLAALDRDNQRSALEQLRALAGWPADPRLAAALCDLVEAPPYRHRRTWQALQNVLLEQRDPRTARRLEAIDEAAFGRGERDPWRELLVETRAALRIRGPRASSLTPEAEAALAEVRRLLPCGAAIDVGAPNAGALLEQVFADPHSDELRQVYADVLLSQGDARGELITLQLLEKPDAAQRRRERQLLKEHGQAWLGPLAAVLQKGGLRWARGFPAVARVEGDKLLAAPKLVGHPAWSTFEELVVRGRDPTRALVHEVLAGLRTLSGVDTETALALLGADPPRPLERLSCTLYLPDEPPARAAILESLGLARGLPRLRELALKWFDAAAVPGLLQTPLGRRLTRLRVSVPWAEVPALVAGLHGTREGPEQLVVHETFRGWNLCLARGPDGTRSELSATHTGRPDDESVDRIEELLGQIGQITPKLKLRRD
jgi:uncharacterized protein (TIGR02996 family)